MCAEFVWWLTYMQVIPKSFYAELPAATLPVVLSCGNKSWAVSYLGDCKQRRFDSRWRNFAVDNHLKVGDACIFELMDSGKSLKFKVQILDGSIPSFVAALDYGSSSNSPITIDWLLSHHAKKGSWFPLTFGKILDPCSWPLWSDVFLLISLLKYNNQWRWMCLT